MDMYLNNTGTIDTISTFALFQWLFMTAVLFIVMAHTCNELIEMYRNWKRDRWVTRYRKRHPLASDYQALAAYRRHCAGE